MRAISARTRGSTGAERTMEAFALFGAPSEPAGQAPLGFVPAKPPPPPPPPPGGGPGTAPPAAAAAAPPGADKSGAAGGPFYLMRELPGESRPGSRTRGGGAGRRPAGAGAAGPRAPAWSSQGLPGSRRGCPPLAMVDGFLKWTQGQRRELEWSAVMSLGSSA